jgi:hypothetical protein
MHGEYKVTFICKLRELRLYLRYASGILYWPFVTTVLYNNFMNNRLGAGRRGNWILISGSGERLFLFVSHPNIRYLQRRELKDTIKV